MRFLILFILVTSFLFGASDVSFADVKLPSYAQGEDLKTDLENKGKSVTNLISLIVAILAIIGMLVGAGWFASGNHDKGKQVFLGGVFGLILAGSVYGIAAIFV